MNEKDDGFIEVEILSDCVSKRFVQASSQSDWQREKFRRELSAYKFFEKSGVSCVPRLISYDEPSLSLVIERIPGGDLCALLENGEDVDMNEIINQMIKIDLYLFKNRINYMNSSPKDVIFDKEQGRLFIIDFEYTFLNEYFQNILYSQMFHTRMMKVRNAEPRDLFLRLLMKRRGDFKNYHYRKVKNFFLSRFGLMRGKE